MNELVREGKVRYIATQDRYNLLERDLDSDVVPVCEALGIGLTPFTPLASGLLTGN
jgi:aryl-alcohol dehydrogenase-like predicted oxidoreductase